MSNKLRDKMNDEQQGVYLLGTTPPRAGIESMKVTEIANKLLSRLNPKEYDGLIVYDIQDESSRIDKPHPFKFRETTDPRVYSHLLQQLSGVDLITYKSVSQRDEAAFNAWLDDTAKHYDLQNLVLVGCPSSSGDVKLNLDKAYQVLGRHYGDFCLGGVTIAERHAAKFNEHQRILKKKANGVDYFISQAVYNPQATMDLLTSYAQACRTHQIQPKRIILTFAPCGSEQTLAFMNWLGINVPKVTQFRMLSAKDVLAESVHICCENFEKILQHCAYLDLPLGLNIESLTNRKREIDASVQLFRMLKSRLEHYLQQQAANAHMITSNEPIVRSKAKETVR